jgi:bla regulator protein BlaR1
MNILNLFSSNEFVHALGWTILHSVWQIALVAILLGILMVIFKKSSSSIRYYVSVTAMVLTFLIAAVTFFNEYKGYKENDITAVQELNLTPVEQEFADAVIENASTDLQSSFLSDFKDYFERNLPLIVVIWNLIVMLLFLKIIGGLAYSQRLKSYQTYSMPEKWEAELRQLSKKLSIQRSIQILQSAIIKVPVVVGYFKPVIILPLGVISGFSHEQVEAILAHELAHIRRNDYLINIFQSIIEVLFFYHPAIYWISKNIRNERENACDDLAILANIDRKALATALTNLEVLNHEKTLLALAFSGNKASLFNRVKRILNPQKTKVTMKEGIITIAIVLASLTIMSFSMVSIIRPNENNDNGTTFKAKRISTFSQNKVKDKKEYQIVKPIIIQDVDDEDFFPVDDTIVTINQRNNIIYQLNGVPYRLDFDEDAELKKFSIKGKEIPKDEWADYNQIISEAMAYFPWNESDLKKQQIELQKQETELKKQKEKLYLNEKQKKKNELEMALLERKKQEMENQLKELEVQKDKMKSSDKDLKEQEEKIVQQEKRIKKMEREILERSLQLEKKEQLKMKKEYKLQLKKQELDERRLQLEKQKTEIDEEHQKKLIRNELVEEMKKDGLIEDYAIGYKLQFSENDLAINDVEQSDEVYQKYKRLFEEKSKGKFKISDLSVNLNQNYIGKTEEEVFKIQLKELEKHKAGLTMQEKKLDELLAKLKLEMGEAQKSNASNEEKKRMQEEFMKKHETILQEQKKLQFEVQQLEIEHKNLIKRMNKNKNSLRVNKCISQSIYFDWLF